MNKNRLWQVATACLLLAGMVFPVLADDGETEADPGKNTTELARVTMGVDLTQRQRMAVYEDFGIAQGSVEELPVSNREERAYLEGLVPEQKIGNVTLSCTYIRMTEPGSGLEIHLHNINYCTEQMYENALRTAGVKDAAIIISAPFPVSGTGALTGIYKAYEDMTGNSLNSLAKAIGAEELVMTGELAEYIGSQEAAGIIAELKGILDQTQGMTDDAVRKEIDTLAETYHVTITAAQREQILGLVRKLEGLDTGALQEKLSDIAKAAQTANAVAEGVSRFTESVKSFFSSVGDFFSSVFHGKSK